MKKEQLHNNIINNVSKSLKDILNETIGTLQLNENESILIDKIFEDLSNKIYLSNSIEYKDFSDIQSINKNDDLYLLAYDITQFNKMYNTDINWIRHLQVIVCNSKNTNVSAAALIENENQTIFTNDSILLATIVIVNPEHERFPKNHIAHELNHYYSEFRKYQKTDLYSVYPDLDINITDIHYIIDFSNIRQIQQNINNLGFIRSVFIECLYWLNESEIKAHIEDIFYELEQNSSQISSFSSIDDLDRYSKTLRIYRNIEFILHLFQDYLNDSQKEYLQKKVVPLMKQIYNRKRVSLEYIYSKQFAKIKKAYKHVFKLAYYVKNKTSVYGK